MRPHRSLEDDLVLQTNVMSYGGNGVAVSLPPGRKEQPAKTAEAECACASGKKCVCATNKSSTPAANGEADFARMTPAQKVAYHKARWDRILG